MKNDEFSFYFVIESEREERSEKKIIRPSKTILIVRRGPDGFHVGDILPTGRKVTFVTIRQTL
jgi:hypothetical protein